MAKPPMKPGIKYTVIILSIVAVVIYLGFMYMAANGLL